MIIRLIVASIVCGLVSMRILDSDIPAFIDNIMEWLSKC